jgi:electron transport complex protein RnfD
MLDVILALVPTLVASTMIFGLRALLLTVVCAGSCVLFEYAFEKLCKKDVTVGELSAVVTGVLLAYNLPPELPLWMAVFGSLVAIVAVKQLFGGIGHNFANPAITARIALLLSFSQPMTQWLRPMYLAGNIKLVSGATPLALMKSGQMDEMPGYLDMFLGLRGGCIGETFTVGLLIGGAYLLYRRVITPEIPLSFIGTVFAVSALAGQDPVYHLLSGGLVLGAFFMATDYSTSPPTSKGKIVFGVGCGLLTVVIRLFGTYPEGVSFAILLMNIMAPHIANLTTSKPFGGVKA